MDESNKVAPQDAKTDSKTETLDSTLGSQESQIQPENALKAENQEPAKSEAKPVEATEPKAPEKKAAEKTVEKAATRKKLMNNGNELKKALDSWNQLAKEPLPPSPNEQMLNDVKDLLKQLKDKIEEFK